MIRLLRKLDKDDRGATAVEYGLICSLIVIAIVGALHNFADTTVGLWNYVANNVMENV
jgi:pilus assembly protein Flp/PilA